MRYSLLGRLVIGLALSWCRFGNAVAEGEIRVDVPIECEGQRPAGNGDYPFLDRLGDARFAPEPLTVTEDTATLVHLNLDLPVSAALMEDRETLLIANYRNLSTLNIHTGETVVLDPNLGRLANQKYVPTGVAIGRRTGRVFLANYLANDILIGHIDGRRIVFDQALTGDGLVSAENVAVAADEAWIVSANFDGSSATAFALEGERYVQKWTAPIPSAHGVAILGDMVFVSSLIFRKIVVLNLNDGREIGSFGQPGWNAACLDFLWPTGIEVGENGVVVIADAHTGGIYRIAFDGPTGKLLDVVGGTAPGPAGLQMPYSAIPIGDDLAILSTFAPKVPIIGPPQPGAAPAIKTLIVQEVRQTRRSADREQFLPLGVGWNGYVHMAAARSTIAGFPTVPSYGALMRVRQAETLRTEGPLSLVPDTLRLFRWSMYFIEATPTAHGVILSSPSAPFALYLTRGQSSCFLKVDLPGAPLAGKTGLEHKFGITRYAEIEEQVLARLRQLDRRRGPDDFVPLSVIAEFLDLPVDSVHETVKTGEGKHALVALAQCEENRCGEEQREAAISRYKSGLAARLEAPLLELLLLDMTVHRCTA